MPFPARYGSCLLSLLLGLAHPASAQPVGAPGAAVDSWQGAERRVASGPAARPDAESRNLRRWLMRIHEAASTNNFQGTFVVSGGGSVASARMAHFREGADQYERIESLDGQPRHVFRHNDLVHTLWPSTRVAVVEQRDLLNSFPALLQSGADRIGDFYDVQLEGEDRVAGYEADVLTVTPRDAYRYGYRLWADKGSGLLLRADVVNERGAVVETSAFSDIAIGIPARSDSVLQPMRRLDGFRVLRPVLRPTRLEAEGWAMQNVAPGFRQVSCVSRELEKPGDPPAAPGARQVLQTIYADGMTYVSVFIEHLDRGRHQQPALAATGATQSLSVAHGEWWITIVGDAPVATLRLFAAGLQRKK